MLCNMKLCYCILTLALCIYIANGWVLHEVAPVLDPGSSVQGYHCLAQNFDVGLMKKGETKSLPGKCGTVTCGEMSSVTYHSCSPIEVYDGCYLIPGHADKTYPDCCDRVEC